MKNLKPVLKEIFDFAYQLFFALIALDISFQYHKNYLPKA